MAKFNIYEPFEADLSVLPNILWQYEKAENLKTLINKKNDWLNLNFKQFFKNIETDFINISTANEWGLRLWEQILQVPRVYSVNSEPVSLNLEQFRTAIQAKLIAIRIDGTIPELNRYINFIFGKYGRCYVIDNYDMTITYHFEFNLTELQLAILQQANLLLAPAGVKANIIIADPNTFGFEGSELQPFNQAPFAKYPRI